MNTDNKHYLGHRRRLRERFADCNGNGMPDYELLELMLTYALPRRDVKPIAKELLAEFKNLPAILDANHEELTACPGMGDSSAIMVKLMRELNTRYLGQKLADKDLLSCPEEVAAFARTALAGRREEAMIVIYVDIKNRVISYEQIHEGTVDHAVVYPRKILRNALQHHSSGIIVVHNHPSGECQPSNADRQLTKTLKDAAAATGIRFLDHLIVSAGGWFSFQSHGMI